jgi:hypothetical protein
VAVDSVEVILMRFLTPFVVRRALLTSISPLVNKMWSVRRINDRRGEEQSSEDIRKPYFCVTIGDIDWAAGKG